MHSNAKGSCLLFGSIVWILLWSPLISLVAHGGTGADGEYRLENNKIARIIQVKEGEVKTLAFEDKPAAERIPVDVLHEFRLRLSQGTDRSGTDRWLYARDFRVLEVMQSTAGRLVFKLYNAAHQLEVQLIYELGKDAFYVRKSLKIFSQKRVAIERIDLEIVQSGIRQPYQLKKITARGPAEWKPGLGQPLYGISVPFFMGVEFPASYNYVEKGVAYCGYQWGRIIEVGGSYMSYPSVWGIGKNLATVDADFQSYIDEIRIRPLRLQVQYNSWFDFSASVDKEKFVSSVSKVNQELVEERGVPPLNAYVIDDGWQDTKADWSSKVWRANDKFDENFQTSFRQVEQAHSTLGLWLSPGCLFGAQPAARKLGDQGFEILGNWMSLAGPRYMGLLEERMLELTREGISYFKLDGLFGHLNTREFELHGNRYGIPSMPQLGTGSLSPSDSSLNDARYDELKTYYLVAGTERLMEIFKKQQEINPEVYIVISNGAYLSPWWLMYVDAVWMINAGDAASGSSRTDELVYRDGVYHDIWKKERTQFPMNSVFNHEPKKTSSGESKDSFKQYLLMNLSRGTGFIELYLKTAQLSESDWDVLAEGLKWAHKSFPYFRSVRMHGGDPAKREVYGYSGWNAQGGYISIHNPDTVKRANYRVRLNEELGLSDWEVDYSCEGKLYQYGDSIELDLSPGEVLLLNFQKK